MPSGEDIAIKSNKMSKLTPEFKEKRITMINNYNPDWDKIIAKSSNKSMKQFYDDFAHSKEYAESFIKFLKKYDEITSHSQYHPPIPKDITIKSFDFFRYHSFKKIVCELFYQAINSMPHDIIEYTITFKNTTATNHIIIGILDDYDEDNEIAVAKIINQYGCSVPFNKSYVQNLYLANRANFYDEALVDTILHALYLYGEEPSITTSYKSTPKITKW